MSSEKDDYLSFFDTLDEFLSRQELQRILIHLTTFKETDIDTLKRKLDLPLEVVIRIMYTLLNLKIVERTQKGTFKLTENKLGTSIKTFYRGILERFLEKKISEIIDDAKDVHSFAELENILRRIDLLFKFYRPMIDEKFNNEIKALNIKLNDLKKKLKG